MAALYAALAATVLILPHLLVSAEGPSRRATHTAQGLGPASVWHVTLRETDGVELDFRMTFAATADRWEAWSRQGAVREMVGGGTALLGRLFGKMPAKEALIYIGEGSSTSEGDTAHLTGTLESPFLGRRRFVGTVADGRLRADLTHLPSGAKAGTLEAVRDTATTPIRDYAALALELEAAIRANLYDPALLTQREFVRFFADLKTRFASARDDLDVVVAFQALTQALGTSHFDLIRAPRLARASLDDVLEGDPSVDPSTFVRLTFPVDDIAHLRITKWDRVGPRVDAAFERMAAMKAQVLILDIRGNPGGDASSVVPFTHLVRERTIIGAFLARPWFDRPAAERPAPSTLPVLDSDSSPAQLIRDLQKHGGVTGVATPREPHFDGPVYLLVDQESASASEPLTYALKAVKRATVIGERTAGKMLTALPQGLRDGWVATIPRADYVTADGKRLEGVGVEPDVKTDPNDVFIAVADRLAATLPFSAAALRAGSYETLKRPELAERHYRQALTLTERQSPPPSAASRAWIHKRLANILKTKGDRAGALREYEAVLKLVPDDKEALAAVRGG